MIFVRRQASEARVLTLGKKLAIILQPNRKLRHCSSNKMKLQSVAVILVVVFVVVISCL